MEVGHNLPRRDLHPIDELCELLGGISRTTLYQIVKEGRLKLVKIGSRSFATDEEKNRYLASLKQGAVDARAA